MFLCLLLLVAVPCLGHPSPPVTTVAQGQLEGRWLVTRGNRTVAAFRGIPYADPPLGHLRFEIPQPPRPWRGVYLATQDAPGCSQSLTASIGPIMPTTVSEDCLFLNVYSPCVESPKKLPVMVFVHGGSFEFSYGGSVPYGPDYLLDEDVILVTLNYRLGILGFLTLEHPVLSGNLGLKDQRAAFRWVKDNIARFGGDPQRVTIFGESVGGASIQFHMIFTAKEGLFRAGISSSGSAWSPAFLQPPGSQRPVVDRLISITGCPRDPYQLVQCLRQLPAALFVEIRNIIANTTLMVKKRAPLVGPMIEPDCATDPLITTTPWNTTMNLPLLQGTNENEGVIFTREYDADKTDVKFMQLNDNYRQVLPYNIFVDNSASNITEVADELKMFYFGNSQIDRENYLNLSELIADARINYGTVVSVQSNRQKTFFYQLNYRGSNTYVRYLGSNSYYAVTHQDDLFFVFPMGGPGVRNITESDTRFSRQFIKFLTNFATFLDPTPTAHPVRWCPVTTPSIEYFNMGQRGFTMESGYLQSRMDFWNNLPFRNKPQTGRPQCPRQDSR